MSLVLAVLAAVALPSAVPPSRTRQGPPFPRIANCYAAQLTPTSTEDDLREIARYDLLIGGVWANWSDPASVAALRRNMEKVRCLNPSIVILDFSCSAPYAYPSESDFPADGWLLQTDGRPIDGWPGTRMADLTRPAVVEFMVGRAVRSVKERGFDGAFIDCMGSGFDRWAANIASGEPYTVDTDCDGKPDDPATLDRLWTEAKTRIANGVRERLGEKALFMTNQAGDWGLPSMNGILLEDYLDYVLAGNLPWESVLSDYLRWTTRSRQPTLTTIVSSSGIEPPFDPWKSLTEQERNALLERGRALTQRMRFGLTTTLLGDGFFAYDLHTRWRGQRWWYPEYDAKLGYPKGPARRRADGAWERAFDGGRVVVNPGELDVAVRFASPMRDVSTGAAARRHVVPGADGRLFVPAPAEDRRSMASDGPAFTLSGPERVVLRPDKALVRLPGGAAVLDASGRVTQVTDGRRALATGIGAFVVTTPWRDHAYRDATRSLAPDGALRFTCERVDGESRVRQEQTVRVEGAALVIAYRWTALSATRFVMFRHQTDLPVSLYGSGRARAGAREIMLPAGKSAEPRLLEAEGALEARTRGGAGVRIAWGRSAQLVDERHYGVAAYRAGAHPAPASVKPGDTWSLTVRIELAGRR